jgi:multidrug efflux pump subunit AcrA (membrane-fusion protein)
VVLAAICGCRASDKSQTSTTPAGPPSVVRLSPEGIRAGGIESAVAGEMELGRVLTLTGTLAEKPWTPEEQAALSDAESADAKLHLAQANLDRLSRLWADGIASRQDLDVARAGRDQARAAAAQADAKRANLGLSEARGLGGPQGPPPSASSSVGRQAKIWGLANLSEADFARVSAGAKVEIATEAFPGRGFPGGVVAVSRSADPQTRSFTVRIAIEDPSGSLRPQMLATFTISTPAPAGLAIPRSALLLEGDGSYVYVAQGDTFRRQRVKTGDSTSEYVTIKEGVSPGQRVVIRGAQILESERLKSRLRPADQD